MRCRVPRRASRIVDLKALGGTLSCVSQLANTRVLMRAGCVAAKRWAIAPPVSLATRSTVSRPSSAQTASSISANAAIPNGCPGVAGVLPWSGKSSAMHRRVESATALTT